MTANPASTKRALIVKMAAIGDVVMAVAAVRLLFDQGYAIDWVCGKSVYPLLQRYTWVNAILADDRAILKGSVPERIKGIAAVWRAITRVRYDLCATLYYDPRYRILTLPVRAARKLEFSRLDRSFWMLQGRNHVNETARILLQWDDSCRDTNVQTIPPDNLPPSPLPPKTAPRRIAMVPGGASNLQRQQILRRWPVERYAALAQTLVARGWEVVLLGGPDDEWVLPHFTMPVTNTIPKLPLPEVISVCNDCDAVVSHDTGPLHLAGVSSALVVGIFGPTDPSMFLPRRPGVTGIWGGKGFACRPCFDGTNFAPCQFNGCMHQVGTAQVLEELDRLLDQQARGLESAWRIVVPPDSPPPETPLFVIPTP